VKKLFFAGAIGAAVAGLAAMRVPESTAPTWIVVGAQMADGTGKPLETKNVRISGDQILEVGALDPKPGEKVVSGNGLVLAPGFIDVHNHSEKGLVDDPLAETQISQGITTLVIGADGDSPWPIGDYLEARRKAPATVNVMTMVGHATVRSQVLGEDYKRHATKDEIVKMAALVDQGMREGGSGLSSGLEYDVGSYSSTGELIALSKAAARRGGFYMTHTRDEGNKSFKALQEAAIISHEGGLPLEISHIKLATVDVWGKAAKVVTLFQQRRMLGQDVTADCYPYEAWHADLYTLVPNKKYFDKASVERGIKDVGGPSRVTITACKAHPEYVGRNLEEIAKAGNVTPAALFSKIIADGGADVIGHSMKEEDVFEFYKQPWVMVASDGGIHSSHPRGAGTFPRVLGRYVRVRKLLTLEEAIRKMTSLPARRMKLSDRGVIAPGRRADLVLFDPKTVIDHSTFTEPEKLSEGIVMVTVNGQPVWEDGKPTGARPGRVLIPEAAPAVPAAPTAVP
jgi:N-acyl-D-amino-acid deacylase